MTDHRARLTATTRTYKRTERAHEQARTDAIDAALDALRGGLQPTEVAALSPFTDVYLRRLARQAGIPPAPPGPKRRAEES